MAYSHSLMELLEQLERADRSEVSDGDAMLRKKFQAGVSDANLRWELSRVLKDDSTKFVDLRKVALQWADQCHPRETEDPRRAKVHTVEASALEPVMDTMRKMQEAMAQLTTQRAEQQRTILQLQGHISSTVTCTRVRPHTDAREYQAMSRNPCLLLLWEARTLQERLSETPV